MKNVLKYVFLSVVVFTLSIVYIAFGVKGEIKPYYSGDAVFANGKLIFGSMNNDGVLELFEYSNSSIKRGAVIKSSNAFLPLSANKRIYDFALTSEDGKAFVYTAEGKKLSKYNINNIEKPVFVNQVLENNGDWYTGLKKYENRLMTVGTKGVKLWNYSLQNIDNLKILNDISYNVGISNKGEYIFNIGTSTINFFNTATRSFVHNPQATINDDHYRKSFYDAHLNKLFMVDDEKVNQFSMNGVLTKSRNHISSSGYDIDGLQSSNYLYMTDGLGVVKLNKANLNFEKWAFTTNINNKKGGWAMGLNVVNSDNGEKVVIFNNNNIVVMDSNLKVLGTVDAIEESEVAFIDEPLTLKADRTSGPANTPVLLSGTGFAYNENLEIVFANKVFKAQADKNGRFKTSIIVPSTFPTRTDIKVNGIASKLTYSLAFSIE